MDLKRYEKVTGDEALIKLLDGERIYNRKGNYWTRKGEGIFVNYEDENGEYESTIPVIWFVDSTVGWYVKKPFDVRAEMLARPNEWVGAFKNSNNEWMLIGFDESKFGVSVRFFELPTRYLPNDGSSGGYGVTKKILDNCIPIEDVPKEELS